VKEFQSGIAKTPTCETSEVAESTSDSEPKTLGTANCADVPSNYTLTSTSRRIPSANAQVEAARSVLKKPSAGGGNVPHPWQHQYDSKREALEGIRRWRAMTPPRERPTEYQIARVPCVKNKYMISAIYDEEHVEFLVQESAMIDFESLKKNPDLDNETRKELPSLWEYLGSCLE
jgi:hypothetical protein